MKRIICPKCQGKGILPNYKHIEDGICFLCYGLGNVTQEEYKAYEMEGIKADERRAKRMQQIQDQREQWELKRKENAIQRKKQKEQEEKDRKERDEYNKNHPVQENEADKALQLFFEGLED